MLGRYVVPHSSIERSLERIEEFLQAFRIDDSELGIVLSPGYNEEHNTPVLEYYVRSYDEMSPKMEAGEPVEVSNEEFREEIYPSWVEEVEERYGDASQLQYLEPEKLEKTLL